MTNGRMMLITRAMATVLNGKMRVALGGTPHVLVRVQSNMVASVCYVRSMQRWRVFYPYGAAKQTKVTCKNTIAVVKCIEGLR